MHPELMQNPIYARCFRQWQENPMSSSFVGVADFMRAYGYYEDAITVCRQGLHHNPTLVSARLILAHCLAALGRKMDAHAVVLGVLQDEPRHAGALALEAELTEVSRTSEGPKLAEAQHVGQEVLHDVEEFEDEEVPLIEMKPELELVTLPEEEAEFEPVSALEPESETEAPRSHLIAVESQPLMLATMTMARLYAQQGHRRNAEAVYERILKRDPMNQTARKELTQLRASLAGKARPDPEGPHVA